jgi:hypothetical protein
MHLIKAVYNVLIIIVRTGFMYFTLLVRILLPYVTHFHWWAVKLNRLQ